MPDYIDVAFKAARKVGGAKVKLFYNDYSADAVNSKSDAIFKYVQGMVQRGIPIDGVGLQVSTTQHLPTHLPVPSPCQRCQHHPTPPPSSPSCQRRSTPPQPCGIPASDPRFFGVEAWHAIQSAHAEVYTLTTCVPSLRDQFHWSLANHDTLESVASNMARLDKLGLEVHITELDIKCTPKGSGKPCTPQLLNAQAKLYEWKGSRSKPHVCALS